MKINLVSLPVIAILLWFAFENFTNNFHTVIDKEYYRSAQLDVLTLSDLVTDHKIASVVNLRGSNPKSEWYLQQKQAVSELNINHVDLKLAAYGLPPINRVKKLVEIIETQPKPILFHCKHGADRSGLASATALLLEGKHNIFDVEDQVSWLYHAVERDSTGKLFVKQYQTWLATNRQLHTPEIFLDWLDNHYIDDQGNTLYTLEQINDIVIAGKFDDIQLPEIKIDRLKYDQLKVSGWTIDYVRNTVPEDVQVLLNDRPLKDKNTDIARQGVVDYYGHTDFLNSGWQASEKMNNLANGCYDVKLQFTRKNKSPWTSKPLVKVCIES